MSNTTPNLPSIETVLDTVIEAAKDVKYLSWVQDLQIALISIGSALGFYLATHSMEYSILAGVVYAGTHIIAMAQEGIAPKKLEAEEVKQENK